MRRLACFGLALAALSACRQEPDFDERYDAASSAIATMRADIGAQIDASEPAMDEPDH